MKKVILFMAGILASMMLNAQSRWSVTPEAGLVVNKENEEILPKTEYVSTVLKDGDVMEIVSFMGGGSC